MSNSPAVMEALHDKDLVVLLLAFRCGDDYLGELVGRGRKDRQRKIKLKEAQEKRERGVDLLVFKLYHVGMEHGMGRGCSSSCSVLECIHKR